MTKRGLNSNASNTSSLARSLTRFASPPIRGKREQRKRASKLHKLSASPPASPPPPAGVLMQRRLLLVGSDAVFFHRKRASDASNARPLFTAETPNDADSDAAAASGRPRGAEGGREGGGGRHTRRRPGREEGSGRRRIVDVVKLQLSYTPARRRLPPPSLSLSRTLSRTLGLSVAVRRRLQHGRMNYGRTHRPTDCGNCFL